MQPEVTQPTIDRIEAVLKIGPPAIIDEAGWHSQAIPTLFSDEVMPAERLLGLGIQTLDELPLDDVASTLNESTYSRPAIEDLRRSRKLLLIGRDALMLSAADTSSQQLNPIFDLSRSLGKVIDARAPKRSALAVAEQSLEAMGELKWPDLEPVDIETLERRCRDNLHTDFFAHRSLDIEETVFHEARKHFRQVVHMAIVACAENPRQTLEELVGSGKALNMRYGSFHNKLVKRQGMQD